MAGSAGWRGDAPPGDRRSPNRAASALRTAFSCRYPEPLPQKLSDRIEMGRRAVEFVGRGPGGLVRTEVVPGRRLRGVSKLQSRLIPPIGQARRLGCRFDRWDVSAMKVSAFSDFVSIAPFVRREHRRKRLGRCPHGRRFG